jgi:hypothetical protein
MSVVYNLEMPRTYMINIAKPRIPVQAKTRISEYYLYN